MKLNALVDDCLIQIFVRLQLGDLMHRIPLVCARWKLLHPIVCKQRRSLFLCLGRPHFHGAHERQTVMYTARHGIDILHYAHRLQISLNSTEPSKTFEKLDKLFAMLPNIISIELLQDLDFCTDEIGHLTSVWISHEKRRKQIKSFKLLWWPSPPSLRTLDDQLHQVAVDSVDRSLVQLILHCPALRHLTVRSQAGCVALVDTLCTALAGPNAIEELHLETSWRQRRGVTDSLPNIKRLMRALGCKKLYLSKLKRLGLGDFPINQKQFIQLNSWGVLSPGQLTHLTITELFRVCKVDAAFLELILQTYSSTLRYLHIDLNFSIQIKYEEILQLVARWCSKKLEYLRVPFWYTRKRDQHNPLDELLEHKVIVPLVTTLHITYSAKCRVNSIEKVVEARAIFPNLIILHLNSYWHCWCSCSMFHCKNVTKCTDMARQVLVCADGFTKLTTLTVDRPVQHTMEADPSIVYHDENPSFYRSFQL